MAYPYYLSSIYYNLIKNFKRENSDKEINRRLPEYEAVIPAKNEEQHISKAILSLVSQTYPPRRIHIIDDHSSDRTLDEILYTLKLLGKTECKITNETLRDKKFTLYKCINSEKNLSFYIWRNNEDSIGKGAAINELVQRGFINLEYFLSLDADTVIEPHFAENLLKEMIKDDKIAVAFGYIIPESEENTIIGKLYKYGREVSYRMGYIIFRTSSNIIGFHYGISGPRVIFKTDIYKKLPRPLDTQAGDTAHAWELQAAGYKIYCDLSTYGISWEPSTIRGFWKQRLKWHSGPFQNFYIRGISTLKKLKNQGWKRFLAGMYTIGYYVFFSTIYHIKWGVLFPILGILGLLPSKFLVVYYISDFLAFFSIYAYSTYILRKKYGYHKDESLVDFSKKFFTFYFWFRPQISYITLVSLVKTIKDIIKFRILNKKPVWDHYT